MNIPLTPIRFLRYASQQQEIPLLLGAFVRRTEPFTAFAADDVQHVDRAIERHLARH